MRQWCQVHTGAQALVWVQRLKRHQRRHGWAHFHPNSGATIDHPWNFWVCKLQRHWLCHVHTGWVWVGGLQWHHGRHHWCVRFSYKHWCQNWLCLKLVGLKASDSPRGQLMCILMLKTSMAKDFIQKLVPQLVMHGTFGCENFKRTNDVMLILAPSWVKMKRHQWHQGRHRVSDFIQTLLPGLIMLVTLWCEGLLSTNQA